LPHLKIFLKIVKDWSPLIGVESEQEVTNVLEAEISNEETRLLAKRAGK